MKNYKKQLNQKKRIFLKFAAFSFFFTHFLKISPINLIKNLKSSSIKFVKKNKKIWILRENDFKKF